jgi:outer membrane protein assembly factor BamB
MLLAAPALGEDPSCPGAVWERGFSNIASAPVADGSGNLYFMRASIDYSPDSLTRETGYSLLSVSPSGAERFQTRTVLRTGASHPGNYEGPVVIGDLVLVVTGAPTTVVGERNMALTAFRTSDGAEVWTRPVPLTPYGDAAFHPVQANGAALLSSPFDAHGLATVALSSGAITLTIPNLGAAVVDGAGSIYARGPLDGLVAYTPSGNIRYQIPGPGVAPRIVGDGMLLTSTGSVLRAADGAWRWNLDRPTHDPIISAGLLWFTDCHREGTTCDGDKRSLFGYRLADGLFLWEKPMGAWSQSLVGPVASSSGTVMFVLNSGSRPRLVEVDATGREVSGCTIHQMDPDDYYYKGILLTNGWIYVNTWWSIQAWRPGRSLATHGWVTQHGNLGGGNRAR